MHIKGFTAVELDYMFRKAKMNAEEGLKFLKDAGLDSLPGGGAEIFDAEIREKICADKVDAEWLANLSMKRASTWDAYKCHDAVWTY